MFIPIEYPRHKEDRLGFKDVDGNNCELIIRSSYQPGPGETGEYCSSRHADIELMWPKSKEIPEGWFDINERIECLGGPCMVESLTEDPSSDYYSMVVSLRYAHIALEWLRNG